MMINLVAVHSLSHPLRSHVNAYRHPSDHWQYCADDVDILCLCLESHAKVAQKRKCAQQAHDYHLKDGKTPAELIAEANAARIKRWFTYLVVMFVVWGFLKLRYPGLADIFESLVFGILTVLVHGLAELFSFLAELLE
ncbi:MAG: hypothetical protein IPM07_24870 [Anaerolineales bacterium]|nr:hypothetical protein [Anaerolineales bacterium]